MCDTVMQGDVTDTNTTIPELFWELSMESTLFPSNGAGPSSIVAHTRAGQQSTVPGRTSTGPFIPSICIHPLHLAEELVRQDEAGADANAGR